MLFAVNNSFRSASSDCSYGCDQIGLPAKLQQRAGANTENLMQEHSRRAKKSGKGQIGVCKLTGTPGAFVKSHLIPRALTPPRPGGAPVAQFGNRQRPSRRFDSWYDINLVTQAGEDILTAYDTFAIQELRRLKLVWQSWGPMSKLSTADWKAIPGTAHGIRRIVFSDPARMRLFFLSLLWRAVSTERAEFAEINLRSSDARRLRVAVRDGRTDLPFDFFPVTLTQISTIGISHNHCPISQKIEPVNVEGYTSKSLPIFRFYFDGLAVHIHSTSDSEVVQGLWPMLVGPPEGTTISTVTWESSWQALNLANSMADAEHEFPGEISRAENTKNEK
jgi:hypothetical protein